MHIYRGQTAKKKCKIGFVRHVKKNAKLARLNVPHLAQSRAYGGTFSAQWGPPLMGHSHNTIYNVVMVRGVPARTIGHI